MPSKVCELCEAESQLQDGCDLEYPSASKRTKHV
jgi:hypothetical protein